MLVNQEVQLYYTVRVAYGARCPPTLLCNLFGPIRRSQRQRVWATIGCLTMLKRRCLSFPRLFAIFLLTVTTVDADNHVTLNDLLNSIDKLVGYYANNYHVMNLDGIFGIRAMEGRIIPINF